uniref:Uncharacterized protein n=1 Tax=Cacopsylla melanoneura TaxID=428564 RepID=A0A8D8WLP5_9HEMI
MSRLVLMPSHQRGLQLLLYFISRNSDTPIFPFDGYCFEEWDLFFFHASNPKKKSCLASMKHKTLLKKGHKRKQGCEMLIIRCLFSCFQSKEKKSFFKFLASMEHY